MTDEGQSADTQLRYAKQGQREKTTNCKHKSSYFAQCYGAEGRQQRNTEETATKVKELR